MPRPVATRLPLNDRAVNGTEVDVHETWAENDLVTVPETTTVTTTERALVESLASTLRTAAPALHVPPTTVGVVEVVDESGGGVDRRV